MEPVFALMHDVVRLKCKNEVLLFLRARRYKLEDETSPLRSSVRRRTPCPQPDDCPAGPRGQQGPRAEVWQDGAVDRADGHAQLGRLGIDDPEAAAP